MPAAARARSVRVGVDGDKADGVRLEHFADQRPDPPVADDDDAAGVLVGRRNQGFGIEFARAPPRQRRAEAASGGIAIIDKATATSRIAPSARSTTPPATAAPIMTKANSPPGPSSSAASTATRPGALNRRPRTSTISALIAIRATAMPIVRIGAAARIDRSSWAPTETGTGRAAGP